MDQSCLTKYFSRYGPNIVINILLELSSLATVTEHTVYPTKDAHGLAVMFSFIHMIISYGFKISVLLNAHLPYSSGLLHWHWGNHMIVPVPVKPTRRIWVKSVGTKPKQSTTKLCIILRIRCMFGPKAGLNVPQQFVSLASVTDHKYAT